MPRRSLSLLFLVLLVSASLPGSAHAHGSVTPEDDLCIIRIGYYRAHFKIYLPRTNQHDEYCEDIPGTGEAIFVMQYEHSGLGDVPIDFRVIRNVTGKGTFTNLEDVNDIDDIEAVTIFHHAADVQPDVFTYLHQFGEEGNFVGIVTVRQPDTGQIYTAVFPFTVGYTGVPTWAWFIVGAIALQINFMWMSGTFARWRRRMTGPDEAAAKHA